MLHPAKVFSHLPDGIVGGQTLHQGNGRHVVFNIVGAGNEDFPGFQQRLPPAVNHAVFFPDAVGFLLSGKEPGLSVAPEGGGNGIVGIQHKHPGFILEPVDVLFGLHIFFHILVNIQMVGGQIGDEGALGTAAHVHQLERAKLHHRKVLFFHLAAQGQQGRADIASQPHGFTGGFQHFTDQGGGGGFSVRAGDGNEVAGADLKKHFHFRSHLGSPLPQGLNGRIVGVHTGGAEQDFRLYPL